MSLTNCDIEIIILLIVMAFLFFLSLEKRDSSTTSKERPFRIDLDMSFVMKGIACVFILIGHYVNLTVSLIPHGCLSELAYLTTANIGLVWFMFFSGYGLSLKKMEFIG